MQRIDEFIEKLESNKTTPNERRGFIGSLTKKEFVYFLKKDFTQDTSMSDLMASLFGTSLLEEFIDTKKSVDTRCDLFEEYIHQTEQLISQFTINELKSVLNKIKPEYITIKNMFTEHLIKLIHNTKEPIDIKKIVEFKQRIEKDQITHEDIRSTLLKMSKEEFSTFITLTKQEPDLLLISISTDDKNIDKMYEYQAEIIAEILEEYTEDEMVALIPFLNEASSRIRTMFFKCLNEKKANEIFLTNAHKYSHDMYSYILSPTTSKEKDEIIIGILSDPKLYSLYNDRELIYLKSLISNNELLLYDNSNVINTTEDELRQEAAKYIANLRCRDNEFVNRGILKKLSSIKLHDLLNEVNKGLKNIEEEPITYKEFIKLINMPLDKAVLFLRTCIELTEEEKKQILSELFDENEYSNLSIDEASRKITNKQMTLVVKSRTFKSSSFDYCYPDLLEKNYNKKFFDEMLSNYLRTMFVTVSPQCMNIFLSQLIEKAKEELGLEVTKEFYVGKALITERLNQPVTLGSYIPSSNTIIINTNAYTEVSNIKEDTQQKEIIKTYLYKLNMIKTIFHELRHAYQQEVMKGYGTVRDLYFMLDQLIHHHNQFGKDYYDSNYADDSREVDAELYAIISTASLLRKVPDLKRAYWSASSEEARRLAKKRKAPQLRKENPYYYNEEKQSLVDVFEKKMGRYSIKTLAETYPMLSAISDDGYMLTEEQLVERYMAVEEALRNEDLDNETFIEGQRILRFLGEYLDKIHNKKMKTKKVL